jgi:hypothetical protein
MIMTIEYDLAESDFEEFNVQHHMRSASSRKRRSISRWVTSVVYLIAGIAFLMDFKSFGSRVVGMLLIPLAIVWFIFHDRYYYWRIRKSTKKLLREGSNAGMLGKQTLMLIDHCFKAIDAIDLS